MSGWHDARVHRSLVITCAALVLCACSPDKGFGETKEVTSDDYGSEWPLTVDTAKLNKVCDEGNSGVALIVEGKTFVISNIASTDDADEGFLRFWAEDSSETSGRKDLAPIVSRVRSPTRRPSPP